MLACHIFVSLLWNVIKFDVTDNDGIPFLAAHVPERLEHAAGLEHAVEICHGIGVIENDIAAQKIDKSARDDIRPVLVLEDLKLPGVLLFEGELVGGDFFGGRQGFEKLPDFAEQLLRSLAAQERRSC